MNKKLLLIFFIMASFLSLYGVHMPHINKEFIDSFLTAPIKKILPNAAVFFAAQTATFWLPCRLYGGESTGLLIGTLGAFSSFATLGFLKMAEKSRTEYKIAAALAVPALWSLYAWSDSDKWFAPPFMFIATAIPACVAAAAVYYGCK